MSPGEANAPPAAPEGAPAGRKRFVVLAVVAVIVVAAIGLGAVVLLGSHAPAPPPAGATLDHVTLSVQGGATTLDPTSGVPATAVAIDSNGADQTANATFTWTASPAAAVTITHPGAPSSALITAVLSGAVTVTATATWNGGSKSGSASIAVNALHFYVTSNQYHPTLGVPFLLTVRIARADNSTDTSFNGRIHFTSTDPTAALPADPLLSPSDQGVSTFSNVIVNASGATTITAANATLAMTGSIVVHGNHPPVAAFTITPSASNPAQVTLDASGSSDPDAGDTLSYIWTFGDTTTGQSATPVTTHTYATTGTFPIGLTVQDNYGASGFISHPYTVHTPPRADFIVTRQILNATSTGVEVTFDASASTGGDGTLTSYAWSFGDGSTVTVTAPVTFHNYSLAHNGQTLTVRLTVTNNYTLTNVTSKSVPISSTALPPVASFTLLIDNYTRIVTVDGSASYTPTGQAITSYNFTWGDGFFDNSSSPTAAHTYSSDSSFTITLQVVNTLSAAASTSHVAMVQLKGVAPVAIFNYTKNKLAVTVNASATFDLNGNLAWLTWTWGDSSPSVTLPASQVTATHTYAAAGLYQITLVANDSTNLHSYPGTRYVSVATSTLDYTFSDFFNVPYGEWWDMRTAVYGDEPIRAYCFNATSIADGKCTPGTSTSIPKSETSPPYTDWYPQPTGFTGWDKSGNDPLLYAPYRFNVLGVNQAGYNVSQPVFLPVLNYAVQPASNSYINFNWAMQYLDVATGNYENNVLGCPLYGGVHSTDDGFMIRSIVDVTMDEKEAARIFGAPDTTTLSTLQSFWSGASQPCNAPGKAFPSALDSSVQNWYTGLGNGKYDVYASFQYAYTPFYTNISGTVDPGTLTTHVRIDMSAWGTDVLMSRFFYWGNASYAANYLNSAAARGWWGMELAWFEDMHFGGSLTTSGMDFNLNTVMQYHFNQLSAPGPDGHLRSSTYPTDNDDVPYWTWGPWLTDYIMPPISQHVSEIRRYTTGNSPVTGYVHSTPGTGTWIYGVNSSYEFVPIAWAPKAGEQWHFVFPFGNVVFYDPNTSPQPSNPLSTDYRIVLTPLAYWVTFPGASSWGGDVQVWNQTAWTWDAFGSTAPPSWPCGCAANQYPIWPYGAIVFSPQGWATGLGNPPSRPQAGASPAESGFLVVSPVALLSAPSTWSGVAIATPEASGFARIRTGA